MAQAKTLLNDNVRLLKSHVSKAAYQGVLIALAAIVIATVLVSYYQTGTVTLQAIIKAQSENYVLWVLDSVPFIFGFWGQYSSSLIAYQAGALIFDQTQELRDKAESLEKQANYTSTYDALTDLPNRALFYDRVEQAILSAGNRKSVLSVLLVEIANFKEIYDTLGRNSSDMVLKQLSARLLGVALGGDKVARVDGNVFGVLLADGFDRSQPKKLAKNIQTALEPVFIVEKLHIPVHVNVGITHYPEHGEDVDTLLQKCRVALSIAAKSNEGYAVYEPAFDDQSPQRQTLMSELRRAIESDQLELYYQAKVALQTGELRGAETLVRWNHPKYGFIPPDEFTVMAERTRMIRQLTVWVLKEAFNQCAQWHADGKDLMVSINLSSRDLHDPELPDLISGIAASTGIRPQWVILEVTESTIMFDPDNALETVRRLSRMGYRFSIDNYGTGYSSLTMLKNMPLTELKIDRSFVAGTLESEHHSAIVNAAINLAHNLGMQVTAEGVENEATMGKLVDLGCDCAQGYYFNEPLAVAEFNRWMQEKPWKPVAYTESDEDPDYE